MAMSLNEKVAQIKTDIDNAYDAVGTMGGTVPTAKTSGALKAAIESIPTGGGYGDMLAGWISGTVEEFNTSEIESLNYTEVTANTWGSGQWFKGNVNLKKFIAPQLYIYAAYMFDGCTALEDITAYTLGASGMMINGCTSLKNITDLHRTASQIKSSLSVLLNKVVNTCPQCVLHGTDKDLKYIGGAWVEVERS